LLLLLLFKKSGPALRAGTRLLRNSQIDQMLELFDDY
jgi:hypothetical protein